MIGLILWSFLALASQARKRIVIVYSFSHSALLDLYATVSDTVGHECGGAQ